MMVHVLIHPNTKSAMQSGKAMSSVWVLEFAPAQSGDTDPLMGWTRSRDMDRQVFLTFSSAEKAIAFAEKKGLSWEVSAEHKRSVQPKSYGDNFRCNQPRD